MRMTRTFRPTLTRCVLTLGLVATFAAGAFAVDNWPEFRGPTGMGHAPDSDPPTEWSESKHVKWKTAIHGRAWSSPVVWGDQVWLTTATEDGKQLSVLCVDANTGKILLDRKLFDVAEPQFAHRFNTYASPTPAIEDGRVYVTFGSPGTACLDTQTLETLWTRTDLECNHFRGAGSSPVIYHDLLLMNFDGSDYQYAIALNKKTGQTVWKTDRSVDFQDIDPRTGEPQADGDWRKGYSTPLVATFDDGKPIMLSLGSKAFYAYDPATGEELWKTVDRRQHSGSTRPVVGHGFVYTTTGLSQGQLLAIRPGGSGDVTESHIAWRVNRNVPNKPSILLIDDLIYMVDDGGVATCLDARTGDEVWRARVGGNHSASPLYVGGRIYFWSEDGKTTVIEPGREYRVVAENQLDGGFMATPAVTGDALIVRTKTDLYRIQK